MSFSKKEYQFFLKLILFLTLVKGIVWSLLVPLWHFPDEQAHFGHVAYLAEYLTEGGSLPWGRNNDLTEEIYLSEEILGTVRDTQGNNRFTFHPEYRLEYSDALTGPREKEIKSLPLRTRKNFVIQESAHYPRFFYQLSSFIYKLFYQANLFIRVFTLRLFWLLAHLLMVWYVWQIAQLIFPQKPVLAITSTLITSLHPMLSFVSSGINSDNLHNLFFTATIYYCLKLIKKFNRSDILGLIISLVLGFFNKPQFAIAFFMVAPVFIIPIIKKPKLIIKTLAGVLATYSLLYLIAPRFIQVLTSQLAKGQIPYFITKPIDQQALPNYGFFQHFTWTIQHTVREVLPWYWGVFNWLGVVLPRWVNRVLMRLLALAGLGLIIKFIKIIKTKKISHQDKLILFITWAALIYFLLLFTWDWNHVKNNGFPFGIQGRYYFPVIASHMILFTLGIKEFSQFISQKITRFVLLAFCLWFFVLQLIGLKTVAAAYYQLTPFKTFIIQASQYKPFFAKGMWLSSALIIYFLTSLYLIYQLTRFILKHEK